MKQPVTQAELARDLGISRARVTHHVKSGLLKFENGKIDLDEAKRQLEKKLDPSKRRGKESGGLDYWKEKAKSERFKNLLLEIEYREKKGKLIDLETASSLWERVIMACRSRLLAIPSKAAPELVTCKTIPELKETLERDIHQALQELASIDPADYCSGLKAEALSPSPEADGQPVGGQGKSTQPRGKRRARAVDHGQS